MNSFQGYDGEQFMKNIFILYLLLLVITACGQKTETSQTKISIRGGSSSLLASGTQMSGGIVVSGHRLDDSASFTIILKNASDEQVLDLIKGQWEFAAIGWEGSANGFFTGANRCAYSGVMDLNTSDAAVNFNLNFSTCANIPGHGAIISHPNFMATVGNMVNQFKPLVIQSCLGIAMPVTGVGSCSGIGLTGSVKIIAVGGKKEMSGVWSPLPGIETGCIALSAMGIASTNFSIPVGNFINGKKEDLMEVRALAYQSADCSGTPISYDFKDSMYFGINQPYLKSQAFSTSADPNTTLYLEHNATTINTQFGYTPYGYGKDGDFIVGASFAQVITDYGRISGITNSPATVTITGSTNSIAVGDEIMWYVNAELSAGSCGGGFVPGMFGFAHVTSKTSATDTVFGLDRSVTEYFLQGATAPIQLAVPAGFNTPCSMQIVRVPNYRNLIANGSTALINVYQYNSGTGVGGLFPFRVSNELQIGGLAGLVINATGAGAQNVMSSSCGASGKNCLQMGSGSVSAAGGGIVFGSIHQINSSVSSGSLVLNANGLSAVIGGLGTTGGSGGTIITKIGNIIYSGSGAAPSIVQSANPGTNGASLYPGCTASSDVVLTNGSVWSACDVGAVSPNVTGSCWGSTQVLTACAAGYRVPTDAELMNLSLNDVQMIWTTSYQNQVSPANQFTGNTASGVACSSNLGGTSVNTMSSGTGTYSRALATATPWLAPGGMTFSTPVRCVLNAPVPSSMPGMGHIEYCTNLNGVTLTSPGGAMVNCGF